MNASFSLCIPRIVGSVSEQTIRDIVSKANLGKLTRVDVIKRKTEKGDSYKRVFIHFEYWDNNEIALNAKQRLLEGKDIKIVYDYPWFWKLSLSKFSDSNKS
jgi:hypothetical protein